MPIETHSVTDQDVLDVLPFDTSNVSASYKTQLTDWIEDGAGILNALLERHGIDPAADMTPNGSEVVKRGIVAYAAYQALVKAGFTGSQRGEFKGSFNEVKETIGSSPSDLGDSQSAGNVIKSNVDPQDPTPKSWDSANFGGW